MPCGDNGRDDYTLVEYYEPHYEGESITFKKRFRNIQNTKMPLYRQFVVLNDQFKNTTPDKRRIIYNQMREISLLFKDDYHNETVICACGRNYTRKNYSRHIKTTLHVKFLKLQEDS